MKEKIKEIFKKICIIGQYIFNMSILTFTVVFAWAYYLYNPIILILAAFGLIVTCIINKITGNKLDFWLFIRSFSFIKLLLLVIYIESNFILCVNDVNKAVVDTALHVGNTFNIPSNTSLNFLESVGAVTLFFGSIYVAHRLLNSYTSKPGPGSESNSPIVSQPIFSEGSVRVDRSTSNVSPIVSQPIFSEGSVRVDRSTSNVSSEVFGSALSSPRSISESIGRCSTPEIFSGPIGIVDRSASPGVSEPFSHPIRSNSQVSNSSHSSPYPDTLSAPGLETLRSEDSIVSSNSFCRTSSSSSINSVEPTEVISINFSTIYNSLPIINFGAEDYNGNILAKDHPNVGSRAFLENPALKTTIDTLIPKDFREFAIEQDFALLHYLENVYKIGFCIQAIIQNIDHKRYYATESILTDLANTYGLIHKTFENTNFHVVYSCGDIIHKLLPKVKNFIIEEATAYRYPVEIALVEYEHFECLFKGLYYYSSKNMPLSPVQYHNYSEALNFVNGVIRKDRNYTELVNKVTERDLTILELTFKNFEISGLSISNCLSVLKVAAYCIFNVNLGPIDDIDTLVAKFLSYKEVNMKNNVTIKTDEAFEDINTQALNKEIYYKLQFIDSTRKAFDFIGEIIGSDHAEDFFEYFNTSEEKENDVKYDDQYNSNYENDDDENGNNKNGNNKNGDNKNGDNVK